MSSIRQARAGSASILAFGDADNHYPEDEDILTFSSSNVRSGSYDGKEKTLVLEFQNGGAYLYRGVPMNVWESLKNTPSKGKFVQDHVVGGYHTKKLS